MTYKLEIVPAKKKSKKGVCFIRLVGANNEIIMAGEQLMNHADAKNTARNISTGIMYIHDKVEQVARNFLKG